MAKMNHKKIVIFVFIIALLLRVFFVFITPMFEKPDENGHFEYIKFVAENKKLPVAGHFFSEYFQPPLYYITSSFLFKIINVFTQSIWRQLIFFRLLSVAFSMITLYIIYKIASLIFTNRDLAVCTVAFAAFLPTHINVNSNTTNANLSQLFATLLIYLLILSMTKKDSIKIKFIIGAVAAAALLTRPSEVAAVLAVPFAYLVKFHPNFRKAVKPVVIITVIVLALAGWHLLRNFALYGDIFAYNAMKWSTPPDDMPKNLLFLGRLLGWTFVTFWATFGRTNNAFIGNFDSTGGIAIFLLFYSALLVVTICSFAGIYKFFKKYLRGGDLLSKIQKKSFLVLGFHIFVLMLFFINFNLYNLEPQGRLLFPAISGIAVFFTFGVYNLNLFGKNNQRKFLPSYLAFFAVLNIISIISVLNYYASF